MKLVLRIICAGLAAGTAGCAHIDFGESGGLIYYEPKPYLFVATTPECVTTGAVIVIPGEKRLMKFVTGYGSAALAATLTNGMIASVGQTTDVKAPETLTSIAALATAVGTMSTSGPEQKQACPAQAVLYPIESGRPNLQDPLRVPIHP